MKRILSVALALTLAGTSASYARGYHGPSRFASSHHGYGYRGHDNTGAAIGLGLFALGMVGIIASQANHDRYDDRYAYAPPPPPPAPAYGYQGYRGNPYPNAPYPNGNGYGADNGYGPDSGYGPAPGYSDDNSYVPDPSQYGGSYGR